MTTPKITITIVHYNKLEKLKNTVSNLESCTKYPFLLKILNNGYVDEEIQTYLSELKQKEAVDVIYSEENLGCPPGRHQLLRDIKTPYAMTLDDDMYVEEGWLNEVYDIFESKPEVGVIGIPYREGDNIRGGASVRREKGVVHVDKIDWDAVPQGQNTISVEDVPGGTMIFRTDLLTDFNWDPQYFVGMGDLDKSLQVMNTDWEQVMATNILFEHDVVTDSEYTRVRKDYRERHRSYKKFVSKWGYRYPLRKHTIFNYFFRLPWPVMRTIESIYKVIK